MNKYVQECVNTVKNVKLFLRFWKMVGKYFFNLHVEHIKHKLKGK